MTGVLHFVSGTVPGYVIYDRKGFPYQRTFRRVGFQENFTFHGYSNLVLGAGRLHRSGLSILRRVHITCASTSDNRRRNSDFSRQNKGFSKGKSKQNQGYDGVEKIEESDLLSSKNGPLTSLSGNPRYQATSTPGQREKEIVELFRKVQAKLRERTTSKEEKKLGASQQGQLQQGDRGSVDSLLKLLRKHTINQGKKVSVEEEYDLDHLQRSSSALDDEQISNHLGPGSHNVSEEYEDPSPISISRRPASNFRRKSPVPRVKFQPAVSLVHEEEEETNEFSSHQQGLRRATDPGEPQTVYSPPVEPRFIGEEEDSEAIDVLEEAYEDDVRPLSIVGSADLISLKVSELRELAKSRGIKGYSKLKKGELVGLLSEDGA